MARSSTSPWAAVALASAAVLSACGGGSSDNAAADVPQRIDSAGRLAVLDGLTPQVRIWDLDEGRIAQSWTVDHAPSSLHASPGGRYAVVVQRTQDQVQFIDGGLWQEDHGDHLHDYRQASRLQSLRLPAVRPTHFSTQGGQSALFNDGLATPQNNADVVLLTDAGIGRGQVDGRIAMPRPQHGTAEPLGDFLLTTHRADGDTTPLPDRVEVHQRSASGWRLQQRLDMLCPGLHGSASNAQHTVFGCTDGVLLVTRSGTGDSTRFATRKLANPSDMPSGARIGTLKGHLKARVFIGMASAGHLFNVNPETGTITRLHWAPDSTQAPSIRAQTFDRTGTRYAVLDQQGQVHWLSVPAGFTPLGVTAVVAHMPTTAPFPSLIASRARDEFFVADPAARQVAVLNAADPQVRQRLDLGFSPTGLAWLGIAQ